MRVCSSTPLASYTSFGFGCLLFDAMLPLLTLCCRFSLDLFAKRACRRNCFLQHALFLFIRSIPAVVLLQSRGPFMPMNSPGSIGANSSCRLFGWADWCAHLIERTWAFFMILQISPTSHPATRKVLRSTGFPGRSMPQRLLV